MRLPFLDREKEKERLLRAISAPEGNFCCLYGRRRCGKSRLLEEVLPGGSTVYYLGDDREPGLQRDALARAMSAILPGFEEAGYGDWMALFNRFWREAPKGAVLAIDEFPSMVQVSPEIPSLLQKMLDQDRHTGLHLIVAGSSQRMMQGLVLDASAPLFGRALEILEIWPLPCEWLPRALGVSDPYQALEAYGVWGGMPRYWELAKGFSNTWDAVENLILDPLGVLHDEPRRLLLDDLREVAQSGSILAVVGQGCSRVSEIAGRMGKPATALSRPLMRLLDLGLLERELPFGESSRSTKKTTYRVCDPFLAFWFRYVDPNRSRLNAGAVKQVLKAIVSDYPRHLAMIWESLARVALPLFNLGGVEWQPGRRWWGASLDKRPMEMDIVAESTDGRCLLVGEVKLTGDKKDLRSSMTELQEKIHRLPFVNRYEQIVPILFVAKTSSRDHKSEDILSAKDIFYPHGDA